MTKLTQILKSPAERTKLARLLGTIGVFVGVAATALLSLAAVSGNM